jgi:pyruvate dehydrogenase E2 component (dihydrolipoamide acetyltransferase)
MANEVVMPRMGLTMEEGTVVSWHKQEGEPIISGEVLLEIETDKVTAEIEATRDGVLGKILIKEGVTVPIGTPIAIIVGQGEDIPASSETVPAQKVKELETTPATKQEPKATSAIETKNLRASPAARRATRELGMELALVQGKGPLGRILESDVRRAYAAQQIPAEKRVTPVAARMAADLGIDLKEVQGSGPRGAIRKTDLSGLEPGVESESEIVELSRAKKLIADRMAYSFNTAPHFYLTAEADATGFKELRQNLLPKVQANAGVRLTFTDLLTFFTVKALDEYPLVNAAWEDGKIHMNPAVNIGIAMDTERGLVVPVLPKADQSSLSEIAEKRAKMTEKARAGILALEDLENGTFTLSNLGTFRVDMFNAVLNPPQAAILAVGRIHEKVIPYKGEPAIRSVIGLSLTCDHRVLDGAAGARFLTRLVELIEEPFSLFI